MKKQVLLIAAVAAIFFAASCQKPTPEIKKVQAIVKVDESAIEQAVKPESYNVTLVNTATAIEVKAVTENGIATVADLVPGNYTVTAHATSSVGASAYSISGSATASIVADGTEVTVKVASSKESALVLKEVYFNGVAYNLKDPADIWSGSNYFRDQFYEVYNNSTETVYADGLCFADIEYANYDYSVIYQWDIPNADQYVFATTIWQIKGSGTDYPIAPGESIIVCQWATNHNSAELADGHSIDLSGAEFEAIEGEKKLFNGILITDGPAVNMVYAVESSFAMPQWLVSNYNASFVMFMPSAELQNENYIIASNSEDPESPTKAREIKISEVVDAINWKENEEGADKLHLPTVLDAGFVYVGSYSGKSVSRKVKETREDGTKVYQDTNNSTNDFEINEKPEIRRDGAKVPAWSTWNK